MNDEWRLLILVLLPARKSALIPFSPMNLATFPAICTQVSLK